MRYLSCCSLSRPPPRPRIFPYTTLFRSAASRAERRTGPTRGRSMAEDVVLSGINKYFGANHVVRDVSLRIPALNFVTLLGPSGRSEEHTSELQSRENLVCRLLLEKKTFT